MMDNSISLGTPMLMKIKVGRVFSVHECLVQFFL